MKKTMDDSLCSKHQHGCPSDCHITKLPSETCPNNKLGHNPADFDKGCAGCLEAHVRVQEKLLGSGELKTTIITTEDYLANPGAAKEEAERVGRVLVRDTGTLVNRLIISSNRASSSLIDKDEAKHSDRALSEAYQSGIKVGREELRIELQKKEPKPESKTETDSEFIGMMGSPRNYMPKRKAKR